VIALILGAVVIARPKATASHRTLGQIYFVSMVLMNATSFFIFKFTGTFGVFHILSLFSLFTLALGFFPARLRKPKGRWVFSHFIWMGWSYIGLWAAFATEITIRLPFVKGMAGAIIGTSVASGIVMVIGASLLSRFQKRYALQHYLDTH
jgi:uncharacterized membrane protein